LPKFVGLAAPNDRVDPRDLVWRRRMDQLRRRCASTEDTNREKRPVRRFVERRTSSWQQRATETQCATFVTF